MGILIKPINLPAICCLNFGMLRYQLYECNVEQIELDRELNYLRNYIDLQKSRIDERIEVTFCDAELTSNLKIAPLLLITFIENAFNMLVLMRVKPIISILNWSTSKGI